MVIPSHIRVLTVLRSQYSTEVLQLVRWYIRSSIKLAKQKEELTFNIRCKHLLFYFGWVLKSLHSFFTSCLVLVTRL